MKDEHQLIFVLIIACILIALLSGIPYCIVTRQWERYVFLSLGDKFDEAFLEGIIVSMIYGGTFIGGILLYYWGDTNKHAYYLGLGLLIFGVIMLIWMSQVKMRFVT